MKFNLSRISSEMLVKVVIVCMCVARVSKVFGCSMFLFAFNVDSKLPNL